MHIFISTGQVIFGQGGAAQSLAGYPKQERLDLTPSTQNFQTSNIWRNEMSGLLSLFLNSIEGSICQCEEPRPGVGTSPWPHWPV